MQFLLHVEGLFARLPGQQNRPAAAQQLHPGQFSPGFRHLHFRRDPGLDLQGHAAADQHLSRGYRTGIGIAQQSPKPEDPLRTVPGDLPVHPEGDPAFNGPDPALFRADQHPHLNASGSLDGVPAPLLAPQQHLTPYPQDPGRFACTLRQIQLLG